MTNPIISICIPTLNRCEQLKATILSIVDQPEFKNGKVEIVISDNASTDKTKDTILSLKEKYPAIIYHRNEKNIGNENFPLVLSLGNGILRKLNNDTLLLKKDSLGKLCEFVEKYIDSKPVLLFPNGELQDVSDEVLSFREFVLSASHWVTWIGAFSIWENDCIDLHDDTYGCNEKLWQVRKVYELASKKKQSVIINYEYGIIQSVPHKNLSYGLYNIFYKNFLFFLKPYVSKGEIDVTDYEVVEKDLLFNFFCDWMIKWELHNSDFKYSESENLIELIRNQYINKSYWSQFEKHYKIQKCKYKAKSLIKKIAGR
ncbi:glycosyltransferase family 2 protein [Ruminococcus flavefaciens]|uniref:glycosyltransferase family 2 protein n=1 Tax=Ruminococcus flavefaciens TaxID=1265 RepID=UPI000463DEF4|nr:glycosyltransferase [Ruminococcus flavefaciens]